jgi:hypothetical protein
MTEFVVDGKAKQLEMVVDGIDISNDFIGNTSHGMATDEDGRYIATQEDYEWWKNAINKNQQMEELIAYFKETNDSDEVDRVVQDWIGSDLETQFSQVKLGLNRNFSE